MHTTVASIDKKMCKVTRMILRIEKEHNNCALPFKNAQSKSSPIITHFIKDFLIREGTNYLPVQLFCNFVYLYDSSRFLKSRLYCFLTQYMLKLLFKFNIQMKKL